MATYKEIVYSVLDEVKASNGDSSITEEYVIFLANLYRLFLIELKKLKLGVPSLSSSNEQTICIDLIPTLAIPGLDFCNKQYLYSVLEVPDIINEESIKVSLAGLFNTKTAYVSKERFKYVGNNKYMKNIIYCTLLDNHVYFSSQNPLFKYLKKARLSGIFEDALKAAELTCDENGKACDIMDLDFPLEAALIPQMLELIVKELLGVNYRPKDEQNNSSDDLADIANFVRRNMKSNLAKQMTE